MWGIHGSADRNDICAGLDFSRSETAVGRGRLHVRGIIQMLQGHRRVQRPSDVAVVGDRQRAADTRAVQPVAVESGHSQLPRQIPQRPAPVFLKARYFIVLLGADPHLQKEIDDAKADDHADDQRNQQFDQ